MSGRAATRGNGWLRLWTVLGLAAAIVGGAFEAVSARALPTSGVVVEVFDGDTVLLDSGEKVRYLGIDAPEVAHDGNAAECYGSEAREANRKLVLHKKVTLQYEKERKDHYTRLLAYVLLPDGRCVNEELIREGCGFVYRSSAELARLKTLLACQRLAIRDGRGMWAGCPVKPAVRYVGNRFSFVFHRPECVMGKQISRKNQVLFNTRLEPFEDGYRPCRRCKP